MISDPEALPAAQASWRTVRDAEARFQLDQAVAVVGLAFPDPEVARLVQSLLVVMAFSVLEEVLNELRDQRLFAAPSSRLYDLMTASKAAVPWRRYEDVDAARIARNGIAHERRFVDSGQGADILNLIENELIAWQILPGPVKITYSFSLTPVEAPSSSKD
jgi:hypothetical protein